MKPTKEIIIIMNKKKFPWCKLLGKRKGLLICTILCSPILKEQDASLFNLGLVIFFLRPTDDWIFPSYQWHRRTCFSRPSHKVQVRSSQISVILPSALPVRIPRSHNSVQNEKKKGHTQETVCIYYNAVNIKGINMP